MEIKSNIPINKITHYAYFFMFLCLMVGFYSLTMFLYKNFYLAITQSEMIIVLKKDIATESFDLNKFNSIVEKIESKVVKYDIENLEDPFN